MYALRRGFLSSKVKPALDDFKAAGLDVVAISTERQEKAEVSASMCDAGTHCSCHRGSVRHLVQIPTR